ncbi:dTDP-4-dehydrorhamnose reductase [Aggregatibacter actinomycetemcomitans D11S-1]|uniref:dTDP-4-dehydrorhamnose reductase n=1 Tax=Aggregatibacter actinomycetemcomitans TaxID=714 RepID=UPI0001B9F8A3|nr:dTDP-4-dehydrorhamnose reductase [Aggregatibacter actinomycetemcomitans]ACX83071.1 dTDP-4-dehydrorhamnose reductase [Aggregatibacter actinomycetemcomitans D11S-1]
MARLLITGAGGQLGRSLAKLLVDNGRYEVLALDFSELDITNKDMVFSIIDSFKPNVIINAAAYTSVDQAELEVSSAYSVNVRGVQYLAEAAIRHNSAILHVSTDYVFDGYKSGKYKETDIIHPLCVYGKSKAEGERLLLTLSPKSIILRTSWTFGEYGNNFVKTMLRLAKNRDILGVVADQIGGPTYSGDIASVLIQIAEKIIVGETVKYGIYHFTGEPCVSWYDFAIAIFDEAVAQKVLEDVPLVNAITTADYPTLAKRPANSCLDLTKIQQAFGIQPSDWQRALKNIRAYAE